LGEQDRLGHRRSDTYQPGLEAKDIIGFSSYIIYCKCALSPIAICVFATTHLHVPLPQLLNSLEPRAAFLYKQKEKKKKKERKKEEK
jgi:hypothetical protein